MRMMLLHLHVNHQKSDYDMMILSGFPMFANVCLNLPDVRSYLTALLVAM